MIADTYPAGLRQKQVEGALTIWQHRRYILADQPGSGKTGQMLVALELDGMFSRRANILITTVQTACQLTWAGELSRRVESQYSVVVSDLTKPGLSARTGLPKKQVPSLKERDAKLQDDLVTADALGEPLIVLANFEMIRALPDGRYVVPTISDIVWDAVVIDESHLVLPTKDDVPSAMTQFWRGLNGLQIRDDAFRVPMSGTPDRGKLENRYGTYKFLYPTRFTAFWPWARSAFVVTDDEIFVGKDPRTNQPIKRKVATVGKLRDEAAWVRFEHAVMLRRTKAEMLEGLPPKLWAGDDGAITLPMTPDQAKAYSDLEHDIQAQVEELIADDRGEEAAALRFTFYQRARQLATCTWDIEYTETEDAGGKIHRHSHATPIVAGPAASNKLAWLLEWLESRGYTEGNFDPSLGKVVIVSYFTEVLKWLREELTAAGMYSEILSGDEGQAEKLATQDRFQLGDLRIVLLSGHMGVSINLDAADDMIFLDVVKDPDKVEQAEDRIHRASSNHRTTFWRLVSEGTADPEVLAAADTSYRETRKIYEGSRGVSFARTFLGDMLQPELEGTR